MAVVVGVCLVSLVVMVVGVEADEVVAIAAVVVAVGTDSLVC